MISRHNHVQSLPQYLKELCHARPLLGGQRQVIHYLTSVFPNPGACEDVPEVSVCIGGILKVIEVIAPVMSRAMRWR